MTAPRKQFEPTSARGKRTRAALLDAACDVFCTQGYADSNVTEITRTAGVGYGSFYIYFASREEIFETVAFDAMRRVHAESRAPDTVTDPVERFTLENRLFFRNYRERARLFELADVRAAVDDSFGARWYAAHAEYVAGMAKALQKLKRQGLIDKSVDTRYTAEAIIAMIERTAFLASLDSDLTEARLQKTLERIWRASIGYADRLGAAMTRDA
ncbi:MAG TPA: TetR/AcrR family transcriptional regulator [Aldersonia sp.]